MEKNIEYMKLAPNLVRELYEKTMSRQLQWRKRRNQSNSYVIDYDFVTNCDGLEIVFCVFGKNNENERIVTKCIKVNDEKIDYDNPEFYDHFLEVIKKRTKKYIEDTDKTHKEFELDVKHIKASDFVIKTKKFECYTTRHSVEISPGTVQIIEKNGRVIVEGTIIGYCPKCKCYFMKEYDYNRFSRRGIVVCRKINYLTFMKNDFRWYDLSVLKGSVLTWQGYNVKSDSRTDQQRQKLLALLIDEGIFTKKELIKELQWNIYVSKRKSELNGAVGRWESDILFLENSISE